MILKANTYHHEAAEKSITKVMWHAHSVPILSIGSFKRAVMRCHRVMGGKVSAKMM